MRAKLIEFFLENPTKKFYQAEVAFKIRVQRVSLQYELNKLIKIGLLKSYPTKYFRLYSLNQNFFLYPKAKKDIPEM